MTARAEHVPARSLRGIVVKLTVAVALRETYGAEETAFPWPILGAALKDLQTMTGPRERGKPRPTLPRDGGRGW
ncbi:hypothetical protein [Azospirillum argentinense]|uniref:hypothetical protein n=1 Tax=Azospirillum argentinense TaxID=2970906 RepID=UPI001586227B|nr:hypothetical protein [Azospirillum argentinense]